VSSNHFSHSLSKLFGSPIFKLWFDAIKTDSTLFEAVTTDFISKDHRIRGDCYTYLLLARCIDLYIIKFCTSRSDGLILESRRNLSPFPSLITLCQNTTSYNHTVDTWGAARFKYIKVPGIMTRFSHLTHALATYTSPSAIDDLVEDADLDLYIARGYDLNPLPAKGKAAKGT